MPAGRVRYANLDSAASARALVAVADQVTEALPLYASVHRGAGYLSQVSTALYESARETVARFVGARDDDVCVFTRNTTDALNLLAGCVPAGEAVLVLDCEHHADLLPWQRRRTGDRAAHRPTRRRAPCGRWRAELARAPYALVAVTGASNVTGESLPLDEVVGSPRPPAPGCSSTAPSSCRTGRSRSRRPGADYVAFSGHKTYAPFGAGALVGRRDWLDAGTGVPGRRRRGARGHAWRRRPGRRRRTGTRAGRPTCSAPSRSPRPARRSPGCPPARWRRTSGRCGSG